MAIEGIDVSHFQRDVDWKEVARAGKRFAFVKATDGPVWKDPLFDQNRTGAKKAGLVVGAYHFARLGFDPQAQAAFLERIVGSTSGELPPAVDLEPASLGAAPASNLDPPLPYPPKWEGTPAEWLREFDAAVHKALGRHPILYFPTSFWSEFGTSGFDKRHAWIAEYPLAQPLPKGPSLPPGWTTWTFWQYSSQGKVPGVSSETNVDMDLFNGDEKELEALLK